MLAESGDDPNHESTFEIINPHHDGNVPAPESGPPATSAPVPNIPPPSALPSFASMSGSTFTSTPPPSVQAKAPTQPPAQPAPPTKSPGTPSGGNPFSIRAAPSQQYGHSQPPVVPPMPPTAPGAPNVMIPSAMPPAAESAPIPPAFTSGPQHAGGSGVEIPFEMYHGSAMPASSEGGAFSEQQTGTAGVWGWFRGAVHSSPLLSKVAETAKSSMNTVIATLDPQMKEYMSNQGLLDVVITLDRDEEIRGVKEGISRVFPASNVRPFVVAAGMHTATQPVGFANAVQAAQQKITYIRNSGYIDPTSVIVGSEGFIVEGLPETWFYYDCLVLDDATRQVQVHAFTQPVQVPNDTVQLLKDQTPADYPFKDLGYAVSVSHTMTYLWSLGPTEWQERLTGIPRMELLKNAALALAYSYRGKL